MIHTAKQLKDKVKNMSGGNSEVAQALIRTYFMERFLERVSVSEYRNNFILKGGMLVASIVGVDMRATMDIDTTVKALPLNEKDARAIIERIGELQFEDGITFKIKSVKEIMEEFDYPGIRMMIEANLERMRQPLRSIFLRMMQSRSITERDPLLCKTVIDLVFHLVDHDDGVCGHPALDLQKKRGFDLFIRQTADQFRFLKEAFLRRYPLQGGMRSLVIAPDISQQTPPELFEGVEIPHIQRCHPLILQGTEPSLDLGFLCGSIRSAVTDHSPDPGGQQLHLPVFVGGSVIKVEDLRSAVLGNGGLHDRHKIHEGIVKKDIRTEDKAAGVVDQGDHINTVFLSICSLQIGTGTGIPAPYFIDVRPFITPHVLVVC